MTLTRHRKLIIPIVIVASTATALAWTGFPGGLLDVWGSQYAYVGDADNLLLRCPPPPPIAGDAANSIVRWNKVAMDANAIDHTPADETVRVRLGNAFDLKGQRRQTDFKVDNGRQTATEAFEIKVRNHKKEAVEVRIVEHLYRWSGWKIGQSSDPYDQTDARTIEFKVKVPPDGEKVVTYRVNYSW